MIAGDNDENSSETNAVSNNKKISKKKVKSKPIPKQGEPGSQEISSIDSSTSKKTKAQKPKKEKSIKNPKNPKKPKSKTKKGVIESSIENEENNSNIGTNIDMDTTSTVSKNEKTEEPSESAFNESLIEENKEKLEEISKEEVNMDKDNEKEKEMSLEESKDIDIKKEEKENQSENVNENEDSKNTLLNKKRKSEELILLSDKSIKNIKNISLSKVDYVNTIFKCGINIKFGNGKFYSNIKSKSKIAKSDFHVFKVYGDDGNSFYRCLSMFLYGKVKFFETLKKAVSIFCKENSEDINKYQNEVTTYSGEIVNTINYINTMEENIKCATDIDIIMTCYAFSINVVIYKYSDDGENIEYVNSYVYDEITTANIPTMILIHEGVRFFLIFPKRLTVEKDISDDKFKKDTNSETPPFPPKLKPGEKTFIPNSVWFNEKKHYYIESNPFPKYTIGSDENLYLNIFNFIKNGIQNGKRTWPDYIEHIKDKKVQNGKKLDFYRKIGIIKDSKLKNIKEGMSDENNTLGLTETKDKYIVENDRLYITRYEFNNSVERKLLYKKYKIPFVKEINVILTKCHNENNHQGLDETLNSIKKDQFYWISMLTDANKFIKKCPECTGNLLKNNNDEGKVLNPEN